MITVGTRIVSPVISVITAEKSQIARPPANSSFHRRVGSRTKCSCGSGAAAIGHAVVTRRDPRAGRSPAESAPAGRRRRRSRRATRRCPAPAALRRRRMRTRVNTNPASPHARRIVPATESAKPASRNAIPMRNSIAAERPAATLRRHHPMRVIRRRPRAPAGPRTRAATSTRTRARRSSRCARGCDRARRPTRAGRPASDRRA